MSEFLPLVEAFTNLNPQAAEYIMYRKIPPEFKDVWQCPPEDEIKA